MKDVRRVYSLLCVIVFLIMIGCAHPKRKTEPIFLYQELQDSVEIFVTKTLPLLDSSTTSSIYTMVLFWISEGDTLVLISPANAPFVCRPGKDTLLGANLLEGRICEVVYSSEDLSSFIPLKGLVNTRILTIPQSDYDSLFRSQKKGQIECDYRFVEKAAQLRRTYILNRPKQLIILK